MSDVRKNWLEEYQLLTSMDVAGRDPLFVPYKITEAYDALSDEDKKIVQEILGEWIRSEDSALRYDAAYVISQRRIKALMGGVLGAIELSKSRRDPGAVFQTKKLTELRDKLSD